MVAPQVIDPNITINTPTTTPKSATDMLTSPVARISTPTSGEFSTPTTGDENITPDLNPSEILNLKMPALAKESPDHTQLLDRMMRKIEELELQNAENAELNFKLQKELSKIQNKKPPKLRTTVNFSTADDSSDVDSTESGLSRESDIFPNHLAIGDSNLGAKLTRKMVSSLKSVQCKKFGITGNPISREVAFNAWIDLVQQCCSQHEETSWIFRSYKKNGIVHPFEDAHNEVALYSALIVYIDPYTVKTYEEYRNMATGLLSRMTYDCCGDRAEARHRLENDFVNMQIKHNESALSFCVRVRKKHGDILRYKSISQRKLVRQVLTGISRHHRSYGMTVILLLKQPHLSM